MSACATTYVDVVGFSEPVDVYGSTVAALERRRWACGPVSDSDAVFYVITYGVLFFVAAVLVTSVLLEAVELISARRARALTRMQEADSETFPSVEPASLDDDGHCSRPPG